MIEVQNLVKKFGDFTAVDRISFRVEPGRILGLLGPNGAGKTTTMRIVTGYMPATAGSVSIAGHDVFQQPLEARRRLGYLPETPPLYPDLTVADYLTFAGRIKGVPRRELPERVAATAARCGVTEYLTKRIAILSKGYRQRVGLAQAMIHQPEVLILDEPTIGLDPNQIRDIRDFIKSLAGGHTVILSTHILPEVTMICDDVVIINRGRIAAADSLANLTRAGGGRARTFLHLAEPDENTRQLLAETPGVADVTPGSEPGEFYLTGKPDADFSADIGMLVLQRGWGLLEMRHERPTLEEVFGRLTAGEEGGAHA